MQRKTLIITLSAISISLNISLGIFTSMLNLPIYLDTMGTVITAVLIGPLQGAIVGTLTNIIIGILYSPQSIPYFVVNVAVAIIVGYATRKYKFGYKTAFICGIILAIVCPIIGTPISIWVYGGLTGTATDIFILTLQNTGATIFQLSFLANFANDFLDKFITCMFVSFVYQRLPKDILYKFRFNKV